LPLTKKNAEIDFEVKKVKSFSCKNQGSLLSLFIFTIEESYFHLETFPLKFTNVSTEGSYKINMEKENNHST